MTGNQDEFIRLDCPRCGADLQVQGEILTCQHCGARLIFKRSANGGDAHNGRFPSAGPVVNGLSLKPFAYYDPQAGLEAFSLMVPEGWQVRGGVTWVPQRPSTPSQIGVQIFNPSGLEAFEAIPNLYFSWSVNSMSQMLSPFGKMVFGYEVCQPMPAREAMRKSVLPRYRKYSDLTIVGEGPAQELVQAVMQNQTNSSQGGQYSFDSVRMRLHYSINNQPVAEEISGISEYNRIPIPGMFGTSEYVSWSMGYMTGFRAARDKLESFTDLYRAMFASIRINPAWLAVVQQVSQGLTNNTIRSIHQVGELSRQISRNFNQITDMNMQGWQERSASQDRISENFSQNIQGVDPYFDPNTGQNVELPSGYTQAWSTPLGEYLVSDDPNFNPNIGSTQTWTQLTDPKK
jgi:hypothetical protein